MQCWWCRHGATVSIPGPCTSRYTAGETSWNALSDDLRITAGLLKKRETILADSLEERILGMYGLGMSLRDISRHIEQTYDTPISHTTLSEITDRIVPKVKAWQSRGLEAVY